MPQLSEDAGLDDEYPPYGLDPYPPLPEGPVVPMALTPHDSCEGPTCGSMAEQAAIGASRRTIPMDAVSMRCMTTPQKLPTAPR